MNVVPHGRGLHLKAFSIRIFVRHVEHHAGDGGSAEFVVHQVDREDVAHAVGVEPMDFSRDELLAQLVGVRCYIRVLREITDVIELGADDDRELAPTNDIAKLERIVSDLQEIGMTRGEVF